MNEETQEWCWHMDLAVEQDDRHAAKALRGGWPQVSKWVRQNARNAERYAWLRDAHDCDWNRLLRDGGAEMDATIDAEIARQRSAPQPLPDNGEKK